jgi:hypothetical protein
MRSSGRIAMNELSEILTSSFFRRSATILRADTRVLAAMGLLFSVQSSMEHRKSKMNA